MNGVKEKLNAVLSKTRFGCDGNHLVTLEDLIKRSGLKQREVAERAGLSPQYLCDIVKGRTVPPFWTIQAIARVLFLPPEDVQQAISAQRLLSLLCRSKNEAIPAQAELAAQEMG